jgi:hypothetical protein
VVQASLGKKRDPISKTREKRAEGVGQVIQCLVRKSEALSSNPSTTTHTHKHTKYWASDVAQWQSTGLACTGLH